MPGADLSLDRGNLAAAALDSRSLLQSFAADVFERSPVAFEHRLLAAVFLPPAYDNVGVTRIELHQARFAASPIATNQGRARSAEQVLATEPKGAKSGDPAVSGRRA